MTSPLYAMGDIHGRMDFLEAALEWIRQDGGDDAPIVFLGDLEDRGPDSKQVIELLSAGVAAGRNWEVIKGNHDRMFESFLRDGTLTDPQIRSGIGWFHERVGGLTTLESYGIEQAGRRPGAEVLAEALEKVPEAHRAFLAERPLMLEVGDLLFVHAGIRPGVAIEDQVEDDLLWIRDEFLTDRRQHPRLVVHGHTPVDMPFHFGNHVNLDGGAGYGRPIYPAVFEGTDAWLLDGKGRMPLVP